MRKLICVTCISLLMSMAVACLAEPVKEPNYTSERARYAKLAVAKDGSKVLAVVFDESKGTGEGYDILYADTDFNGKFDPGEKLQAKVHKCSPTGIHCDFPAFTVDVPFDKKAAGIRKPCQLTLNYAKHWSTTRVQRVSLAARILGASASKTTGPLPGKTRVNENFYVYATVALPEGSERWEYSFQGQTKPSESLKNAPVWRFDRPPALEITTKPDPQKKGHLGIGVNFSSGEVQMRCTKAGQPAKGHVEINKPDGTVAHKEDVGLDKLTFG